MNRIKRLIAGLLRFAVLSVLFFGSCMGPGLLYMQSPRWLLDKVDPGNTGAYFVAFISKDDKDPQQIQVMRYQFDSDKGKYSDVQFHLPNGSHHYRPGPKGVGATIDATADEQGGQLVQVLAIGDTPWTSLSEYRVVDNKIYPLRHAVSAGWILIGVVVCPILVIAFVRKPVRRGIDRLMRIDSD